MNIHLVSPQSPATEDLEIIMHATRLARTGRFRRLNTLRAALREDFRGEPDDRLDKCLREIALAGCETAIDL